jgi:hypothetical protein
LADRGSGKGRRAVDAAKGRLHTGIAADAGHGSYAQPAIAPWLPFLGGLSLASIAEAGASAAPQPNLKVFPFDFSVKNVLVFPVTLALGFDFLRFFARQSGPLPFAAFTIASMPALSAAGRVGQAFATSARSGYSGGLFTGVCAFGAPDSAPPSVETCDFSVVFEGCSVPALPIRKKGCNLQPFFICHLRGGRQQFPQVLFPSVRSLPQACQRHPMRRTH